MLHLVHQGASFELSKTAFQQFFKIFTNRGDPSDLGGGGQNFRQVEDGLTNQKENLFWNWHDKTNTKMGGRSLMNKFWLYGSPLLWLWL